MATYGDLNRELNNRRLAPQMPSRRIDTGVTDNARSAYRAAAAPAPQGNSSLVDRIPTDTAAEMSAYRRSQQAAAGVAASQNPAMSGGSADRQSGDRGPFFSVTQRDDLGNGVRRVDEFGRNPMYTNLDPQAAREGLSRMKSGGIQLEGWDAGAVNASMARANAIRGGGTGAPGEERGAPGGGVIGSGREEVDPYQGQIDEILRSGANSRAKRSMLKELMDAQQGRAQIGLGRDKLSQDASQFDTQQENTFALEDKRQQGAGALEKVRQQGQIGLEREKLANDKNDPYKTAMAGYYDAQTRKLSQREATSRPGVDKAMLDAYMDDPVGAQAYVKGVQGRQAQYDTAMRDVTAALEAGVPVERLMADDDFRQKFTLVYGAPRVQGYAEGGEVQPYGAAPQMQTALPLINDYRDYATGAQRLGLPPVPFDQFVSLRGGAPSTPPESGARPYGAMGFAQGGEIPDMMGGMSDMHAAGGKMVIDTNPHAETDSIPAVIDGQFPAALDSGEFVLPTDVVKFFGTDKLNKMIAQARAGAQQQE